MTDGKDSESKTTPLYPLYKELGAGQVVPFAGYLMPVRFEGTLAEHKTVRTAAGLFDVSHMGEFFINGEHAARGVSRVITGNAETLPVGKALYTVACNEQGGILDDLIIYRLADDEVLIICNASNREKIGAQLASVLGEHEPELVLTDRSDDLALLALQGPTAADVLSNIGGQAFTALDSFETQSGTLLDKNVRIARTGYTGEDGFELLVENEDAAAIFSALLDAGAKPIGLGARDTLRLEARLSLYGNELSEQTHPYQAGLGWVVKLDSGEFVGKDALVAIKANGWDKRLVGFEMLDRNIPRHGYKVLDGDEVVGEVTSGAPAPTVGKNIGLAYVPKRLAKVGSTFDIDIRGKRRGAAKVVKTPFYRRPKK